MKLNGNHVICLCTLSFFGVLIVILLSVDKNNYASYQADQAVAEAREDENDKPDVPRAVKKWPVEDLHLGQVSGVSVNSALQPVVFHRADRVWDRE
nr:unnamed protein product [Callosobruchus analis]